MVFRLCNGKSIFIPTHLLTFGKQFKNWGNETSWLSEFLQKNKPPTYAFLLGEMSMRKLCTYRLAQKVAGQYESYLEPLGGAGVDAKLMEGDPAQTYVNDIDSACLQILRANFHPDSITSLNVFDNVQRLALFKWRKPDMIFFDFNNFTWLKFMQGLYQKEMADTMNAAQKFFIINDCSTFFFQYGKKSYEVYSKAMRTPISCPEDYFRAIAPIYAETGWHLTDVTYFNWGSGRSSYQLFRRESKPLTIEFVPTSDLKANPVIVVEA